MKHHTACWCPRTHTHTGAVRLPLVHTLPRQTSSLTRTAHMQSDTNNIHSLFYEKAHIMHACQLQAPSRRHKQRANGIKPSAQHFHQHKTELLRLFLKVWGVSSLKRRIRFACNISVQNVLFISHTQYSLTRWNAAAVPCYLNEVIVIHFSENTFLFYVYYRLIIDCA